MEGEEQGWLDAAAKALGRKEAGGPPGVRQGRRAPRAPPSTSSGELGNPVPQPEDGEIHKVVRPVCLGWGEQRRQGTEAKERGSGIGRGCGLAPQPALVSCREWSGGQATSWVQRGSPAS